MDGVRESGLQISESVAPVRGRVGAKVLRQEDGTAGPRGLEESEQGRWN